MHRIVIASALALVLAAPAYAQDLNSNSNSGAAANSGSVSGAQSNGNQQGQTQSANNAGIGSSTSSSNSGAASESASFSGARSDQDQAQSLDSRLSNSTSQTQGQTASNMQGVSVSNTFISTPLKRTYVGTNNAVPLVASSSFSSDYCGGTVSGGASVAPIGVSIGASAPKYDDSCRYLRMAEKAGMMGANYANLHQEEAALKSMSLMSWAICMSGPHHAKDSNESAAAQACLALGLLGSAASPPTPPAVYVPPPPVTPPEAVRAAPPPVEDYSNLPPKQPRGEIERALPDQTAFAGSKPLSP